MKLYCLVKECLKKYNHNNYCNKIIFLSSSIYLIFFLLYTYIMISQSIIRSFNSNIITYLPYSVACARARTHTHIHHAYINHKHNSYTHKSPFNRSIIEPHFVHSYSTIGIPIKSKLYTYIYIHIHIRIRINQSTHPHKTSANDTRRREPAHRLLHYALVMITK